VPEKVVAQANALVGILEQAGNIGHAQGVRGVKHQGPHLRMAGGERIGGGFGAGRAQLPQQGRFARVGIAHQPHFGHRLHRQAQGLDLPGRALGALGRGLMGAGFEVHVAQAALAALRHFQLVAVGQHLAQEFTRLVIAHFGAQRNQRRLVGPPVAVLLLPAAFLPMLGAEDRRKMQVEQRGHILGGAQENAAAIAAIAAVGPAMGNVFFAAERRHPVAAVAGEHLDADAINKGEGFHG
jgi:hypothetical protein